MLDDLLDLAADLMGDAAADLLAEGVDRARKRSAPSAGARRKRAAPPEARRPAAPTGGKLAARRQKRGEDPWDWKEEKPPWEG